MKTRVISFKNLPIRLPINHTIVYLLALDYWKASEIVCGAVYALLALIWLVAIIGISKEQPIDILNKNGGGAQ